MIKIIRPGQLTFNGHCDRCGCEFTYELGDLATTGCMESVDCPTCKKTIYHMGKSAGNLAAGVRNITPTPGYLYELKDLGIWDAIDTASTSATSAGACNTTITTAHNCTCAEPCATCTCESSKIST